MYESACTKLRLSRERPLILSRSAQTTQLMRKEGAIEGAKTSTQRWRRAPPRSPDRVLSDDATLTSARLGLSLAVRTVLANGLELLGISAPEQM